MSETGTLFDLDDYPLEPKAPLTKNLVAPVWSDPLSPMIEGRHASSRP